MDEVYRYYHHVLNLSDLSFNPESSELIEEPYVGCFIGKDGKYYSSKASAEASSNGALAMVVYYNKNERVDSKLGYHGLAMALEDVGKAYWGHDASVCLQGDDTKAGFREMSTLPGKLNGIAATQMLAIGTCGKPQHPAAELCNNMENPNLPGFSRWFLPSAGHWIKALTAMGLTWEGQNFKIDNTQTSTNILAKYLKDDGCKPFVNNYYWSSTEEGSNDAWCIAVGDKRNPYEIIWKTKTYDFPVRPFIAFDRSGLENVDYGVGKEQAQIGYILATNGKFYKNQADLIASGQTGAAIVVCINETVESGENYTGLALALKPSTKQYIWGGGSTKCCEQYAACFMGDEEVKLNGLAVTKSLSADTCPNCGGTHPVFQATKTFQPTINGEGFSPWFVPSTGQWIKMVKSFGAYTEYKNEQYVEEFGGVTFLIQLVSKLYVNINYDNFSKMHDIFIAAGATWDGHASWCANYFDYPEYYKRAWCFRVNSEWPNGEGVGDKWTLIGVYHLAVDRNVTLQYLHPMIAF